MRRHAPHFTSTFRHECDEGFSLAPFATMAFIRIVLFFTTELRQIFELDFRYCAFRHNYIFPNRALCHQHEPADFLDIFALAPFVTTTPPQIVLFFTIIYQHTFDTIFQLATSITFTRFKKIQKIACTNGKSVLANSETPLPFD